jgi:hypothetical protein
MDLGCAYTTKIVIFCGKNNKICRFGAVVQSKISIFASKQSRLYGNYRKKNEEVSIFIDLYDVGGGSYGKLPGYFTRANCCGYG